MPTQLPKKEFLTTFNNFRNTHARYNPFAKKVHPKPAIVVSALLSSQKDACRILCYLCDRDKVDFSPFFH